MEIVFVIEIVSADEIGMIEPRHGAGFAIESLEGRGISCLGQRQHFESDATAHRQMFAEVNRAHAAGAEALEQAIFAGDDEASPAAVHELLGLKARQLPGFDELFDVLLECRSRRESAVGPCGFEQSAADTEFQKGFNRCRRWHDSNHGHGRSTESRWASAIE